MIVIFDGCHIVKCVQTVEQLLFHWEKRKLKSKPELHHAQIKGEITFTREIKAPTTALVVYFVNFGLLSKILIENI